MIRNGGSNWVDGENFFDRKTELEALEERVREGTHTLLTAQRRMGKTSLVRALQRRLAGTRDFEVVFVDLEAATDPADAIAEIGVQAEPIYGHRSPRLKLVASNGGRETGSLSFSVSSRSHCPSCNLNTSRVRASASANQRWATPSRA